MLNLPIVAVVAITPTYTKVPPMAYGADFVFGLVSVFASLQTIKYFAEDGWPDYEITTFQT